MFSSKRLCNASQSSTKFDRQGRESATAGLARPQCMEPFSWIVIELVRDKSGPKGGTKGRRKLNIVERLACRLIDHARAANDNGPIVGR
jgi:hypothetical protein